MAGSRQFIGVFGVRCPYFKRIRIVCVSRPSNDCFFGFAAASGMDAPGSGSHGPEHDGQKTLVFPPASRSTWTQSSQKTFWHLTHCIVALTCR